MHVRRPVIVSASLVVLAGAIGTASATALSPKDAAARREIRQERHVTNLLNRASERARKTTASCRAPDNDPEATATHDAPSAAILDSISALRRPATPADAIADPTASVLGFGPTVIYVDYLRTLTAANGNRFVVVIARQSEPRLIVAKSCLDAQHRELVRLVRHETRAVRSDALRTFRRLRRYRERDAREPAVVRDTISLFDRTEDGTGSGGGGTDVRQFRKSGVFGTSDTGGRKATVSGLVPDGVATVDVTYAKHVPQGKRYKPKVFPSTIRKTIPVRDNVVSYTVRRSAPDAFATRMVWRNPQGKVVRTIKGT